MLEPFSLPYVQEGLLEILLLSVPAGLIGSWVVLRGLAFYSHAVGTASFPGLVLADGLGFPPALGAFGMAGVFTAFSALLARTKRATADSVTALALVSCLAAGVILASDVFQSGANVDTLLFGSLLSIGTADLVLAAAAAVVALVTTAACARHWLAKGFDEEASAALASGSRWFDLALLTSVAFTVTAALSAVGALLVAAIMVTPAATARLFTRRVRSLQITSVALVAAQGTAGLWLSVQTNAPPGATIAIVSGAVFAAALLVRRLRKPKRAAAALAVAGAAALLAGCSSDGSGSDGESESTVRVVATTTQVADIVREVGGDTVEVEQIIRADTDAHDYEPRPDDVAAVAEASVVFKSGGDIDQWTEQLVEESGGGATVVDLSSDLPVTREGGAHADEGEGGESHEAGETDPHWWHDPTNVEAAAGEVEVALAAADPEGEEAFATAAEQFQARARKVDAAIAGCIDSVPAGQRKLVTNHDALGYFADRYDIELLGTVIPALTTQAEPSAGDLAELERTVEEQNVKAIFPESSVSPKLAEALAEETGATAEYTLYGDTLGPEGSGAENWAGMMQENADSIMLGFTGGEQGCDFN